MALEKCKECGGDVSTKATSCPSCGVPRKRRPKQIGNLPGLLIIGGFTIGTIVLLTTFGSSVGQWDNRSNVGQVSKKTTAWYSDGTLHSATMSEWRKAPYKNRLATSADFVTGLLQTDGRAIPPVNDLKPLARELEFAISLANPDGIVDNEKVAVIAAMCWILMNQ